VIAREAVIVAGQALIDRNLAGLGGRREGWRAAAAVERMPFPVAAAGAGGGDSLLRTLRRRLARRRRLAAR
jgi:hypothetical protein